MVENIVIFLLYQKVGPILGVCLAVLALKVITKGSPRNDPWGSLHDGKKKNLFCVFV